MYQHILYKAVALDALRRTSSARRKLYKAAVLAALLYDSRDLHEMLIFGRDTLTPTKRAAILWVLVLRDYGLNDLHAGPYPQKRRVARKVLGI